MTNDLRRAVLLIWEFRSRGLDFRVEDGQPRLVNPLKLSISDHDLYYRLRPNRDGIVQALNLDWDGDYPEPWPEDGRYVIWSDCTGEGGLCRSEDLFKRPWVMWRYANEGRWYARTGDSWEE